MYIPTPSPINADPALRAFLEREFQAIARAFEGPPLPILNAEHFGFATGGSNNDGAISDALDEIAEQGGGILQLGPGTFDFETAFSYPDKCTIRGVGKDATTLRAVGNNSGITIPVNSDRCQLVDLSLVGDSKQGVGLQLGSLTTPFLTSLNSIRRIRIKGWSTGVRVAACLWNEIIFSEIGGTSIGDGNGVGIDFDEADAGVVCANDLLLQKNFIGFNDNEGIKASNTTIYSYGLQVLGGSVEGNCSSDLSKYQCHFGKRIGTKIDDVYFEYAPVGAKPGALRADGLRSGSISDCYFNGASYGIRDTVGNDEATNLAIFGNWFESGSITTLDMEFLNDTRILEFANEPDAGHTITGTGSGSLTP